MSSIKIHKHVKREKTPTYNLTMEQINAIKRQATEEAMVNATTLMLGIPCLVCRDLFGFGRKRLERLMDKSLFWLESVHDGEVSMNEIIKTIEEETGYVIYRRNKSDIIGGK